MGKTVGKAFGRRTPVTCDNVEYESIKAWMRDYGFPEDSYTYKKVTSVINFGYKPEEVIEEGLEVLFNKVKDAKKDVKKNETVEPKEIVEEKVGEGETVETIVEENIRTNRPKQIMVEDPLELIEVLKGMEFETVNLIDFENLVHDFNLLKPYITKENTVNIFFYNATMYSNDFYKIIKYTTNMNLQIHTYEVGDQLVDHMITFYLGVLSLAFPKKKYAILSKDNGYCSFVGNMDYLDVEMGCSNYIQDPEQRYKYSLCKYIAENHVIKHRGTITKREMGSVFTDFFKVKKKTPDINDLEDLLQSLCKFDIANLVHKGSFEWIEFKMANINDYLELYAY